MAESGGLYPQRTMRSYRCIPGQGSCWRDKNCRLSSQIQTLSIWMNALQGFLVADRI